MYNLFTNKMCDYCDGRGKYSKVDCVQGKKVAIS